MDAFTNGIPDGWTPFYEDSGTTGSPPRDRYTVYAAWSADGGQSWTGPVPVSENRLPGQGLTGALGPDAYPFLSADGTEPTLHVFALYESGDPPPGTTFIRYGRPVVVGCELGDADLGDARARDLLALGIVIAERVSGAVRAARDGVVTAIGCAVGDLVAPGARLVEIDP